MSTSSASTITQPAGKYPPGDLAIWLFIYAELLAFGIFFLSYAFARSRNVELFNLESSVERAGVCGFPGAGQGATTKNGCSILRSCNAAMRPENRAIQPVALSPYE